MTAAPARLPFLPPDERVRLHTRPGFLFVILYRQGWWLGPPIALAAIHAGLVKVWDPDPAPRLPMLALAWLVVGFVWRVIAWLCRHYVLTDQRAVVVAGVISRVVGDVPLTSIQHVTVTQTAVERLFGLGTVGIATAGSGGAAINWLMVPRPQQTLDAIRLAADAAKRALTSSPPHLFTSSPSHPEPAVRGAPVPVLPPPVIGLAGGIGSGKSEVARMLERLGAVVIDSDRQAKEALDRPEIRDQLVQWWGPEILDASGRVQRPVVADIVFNDPAQRVRLESTVHPIVRASREQARRLAEQHRAPAVVIDAPLLFEAGVDRECDRIIFVDTPREVRLARVRDSRGWDEAELARRESQQLPLEEKRRRSHVFIRNDGSPGELAEAVEAAFREIVRGR